MPTRVTNAIMIARWSKFLFFIELMFDKLQFVAFSLFDKLKFVLLLLFRRRFIRVHTGHGRARNLEDRLVGAPDEKTRVPHGGNRSDHSTGGNNLIAGF